MFYMFLDASDDFCCLPIAFANSLDPDLDRSSSGCKLLTTWIVFLKEKFEKVYFEKSQQTTTRKA